MQWSVANAGNLEANDATEEAKYLFCTQIKLIRELITLLNV